MLKAEDLKPGISTFNLALIMAQLANESECKTWLEKCLEIGALPPGEDLMKDDHFVNMRDSKWFLVLAAPKVESKEKSIEDKGLEDKSVEVKSKKPKSIEQEREEVETALADAMWLDDDSKPKEEAPKKEVDLQMPADFTMDMEPQSTEEATAQPEEVALEIDLEPELDVEPEVDVELEEIDLLEEVEGSGSMGISFDLAPSPSNKKDEPEDEPTSEPQTKEKPVSKPTDMDLPEDFQLK